MRPRLVIFRSNRYFYAQVIDDMSKKTLAAIAKMTDPVEAGKAIADKAKKAKVTAVVFDRRGYRYHGNVKKFADAAREGGLVF